ncbi:alpha-glucosidase [Demequina sp. SYSU T00192]|uniref:Alpha-glucosidase n=1 Tax=Demequina litoralis TaxID=3051660 RepID=A0ABT8GA78_9MICO|nr:alpha-glucosidase [Demequina sp. SYSU T00192]MDN4475882.1 alpha-glucosidase [Demequina sp. SYSU T00192]
MSDDWWKSAVVYQVYPRSFQDSDGDGIGDLAGIRSRLDHLEWLGVDVIWLSPIYASPQADNGYDISDYQAIDPTFGDLEDFDALLTAAHARGMKIVMDLVVNHTSDEHPWFLESRASKRSPKRDWYWWRPPRPGFEPGATGAEPTNWRAFFSGPSWAFDEESGEYYLHLFHQKQPDLNWENPEVRQAVYAMMNWWLDRGVDGFRMDVINLISKTLPLRDGEPLAGGLGNGFPLYACGPRNHEFLHEMHREVFEGREGRFLTVGEMPGVTVDDAVLFTDPERREVDMVFQFEHVDVDHGPLGKFDPQPLDLVRLKSILGRWQSALAERGWNSLYWDNHDQPRVVSRFGDDRDHWAASAKALAAVLHLQRGTPYIYQGEELGMTNAGFTSIDEYHDIESLGAYDELREMDVPIERIMDGLAAQSRDNARTPVQWDASPHAGFTTGTPWLPVTANHTWLNAEAQRADPDSVSAFYRALIALRHSEDVVAHGTFEMLLPEDPQVFAFRRTLDGTVMTVAANLSGDDAVARVDVAQGALLLHNLGSDATPYPAGAGEIPLGPWEARVYLHR